MRLEDYFRDELAYLRETGCEFARDHPEMLHFLSEQSADPDVERLLEGFAFLCSRLRAKTEDEFPELTYGLLAMLWPNYLRPVPSMTVMRFFPDKTLSIPSQVARGCQIDSIPLLQEFQNEDEKRVCHFQTCRDLWVYPADITRISAHSGNDLSVITLDFSLYTPTSVTQLQPDKLHFYLGGDDNWTACELYCWLCSKLSEIRLEIDGEYFSLPASVVKTAGFDREDALLPYPGNVYSGYRILQEFFCFPHNFLFFRLCANNWPQSDKTVSEFKLHFCFTRPLPAALKVRKDSFMINCVPAINLFRYDSEPITLTGFQTEYPLKASHHYADSLEIFSVDEISGWSGNDSQKNKNQTRIYQSFENFQHQMEHAAGRKSLYYRINIRESIGQDGFEHSISFVRSDEATLIGLDESVSASLTCTNRDRAATLRVGDICHLTGNLMPSFASCRNILRPTRALRPLLDASLHWTLISNMSLNYTSLLSRDALVQILRTYDFPALHDSQAQQASRKRLAGIKSITTSSVTRLVAGMPVRGLKSTLSAHQSAFAGEGELYLFSTVLAHFLSLYASVNAFHILELHNLDNQERYLWPVKTGQHAVM